MPLALPARPVLAMGWRSSSGSSRAASFNFSKTTGPWSPICGRRGIPSRGSAFPTAGQWRLVTEASFRCSLPKGRETAALLFCPDAAPSCALPLEAGLAKQPGFGPEGDGPSSPGKIPMKELDHFIAGQHVKGASGRFGDVFNPATGEVQAKVAFASRAEVRKAVEAALGVFPEWSSVNPQRRARVMFNFKA